MKPINTQIATYSPDITYNGDWGVGEPMACMFHDFEGDWIMYKDYQEVLYQLQKRIIYLEDHLKYGH